jgi:hypothetical protein
MPDDEQNGDSFEETLRSMARKIGESIEEFVEGFDPNEVAERIGVDPLFGQNWVENAGSWLRGQAKNVGDEAAGRGAAPKRPPVREDQLSSAAPHPLDLPTEEQGLALAALASGRWIVEPVSSALTARGDGPLPQDTLGIVRELGVRDWIAADGEVTLVGRHALQRWLAAADPR